MVVKLVKYWLTQLQPLSYTSTSKEHNTLHSPLIVSVNTSNTVLVSTSKLLMVACVVTSVNTFKQ